MLVCTAWCYGTIRYYCPILSLCVRVAGFNELRIKDKLIKEIVIKESAKKNQVINDVAKKGI